jgi:purine-binding chemotaxis protein CheW
MLDTTNEIKSYLSFKVGEEHFAINAKYIHSIIELMPITKVPNMPEFMLGIINLRKQAIPVIDTRIQFGMIPTPTTSSSWIIILELEGDSQTVLLGALVDSVSEVIEIEKNQILPSPEIGGKYKNELIEGVIQVDNTFVMLLNITELLSGDNLVSILNNQNENEIE